MSLVSKPVAKRAGKRAGRTITAGLAVATLWLMLLAAHEHRLSRTGQLERGAVSGAYDVRTWQP